MNARFQEYPVLHICFGNQDVIARVIYQASDRSFIAVLPASGVINSQSDERIVLTEKMIERIVSMPDGTIRLNL